MFVTTVLVGFMALPARAYGPEGHWIAGKLAEPLLCPHAAARIATLSDGKNLGELGLWADRIRGDKSWRRSRPWHYMNIADDASTDDFDHPPEGDVLWAIDHFERHLATAGSRERRRDALRFLIHFIVDVHQPLHVGRADDRGGNTIDVRYGRTTVNLHRFWDTDVLRLEGRSWTKYKARLVPEVAALAKHLKRTAPSQWAAESLALRPQVYDFKVRRRGASRLSHQYLEQAKSITHRRLERAAVRLARTLNHVLGC